MSEMAKELSYCLLPPAEARPSASLDDLRQRVEALTATSRQSWREDQDILGRHHQAFVSLNNITSEAARELNELLKFQHSTGSNVNLLPSEPGREHHRAQYQRGTEHKMIPYSRSRPPVEVVIAITLRAMSADELFDAAVLVAVNRNIGEKNAQEVSEIYKRIYRNVPVDSAQQAHIAAETSAAFTDSFGPVMRSVTSILSQIGSESE